MLRGVSDFAVADVREPVAGEIEVTVVLHDSFGNFVALSRTNLPQDATTFADVRKAVPHLGMRPLDVKRVQSQRVINAYRACLTQRAGTSQYSK